MSRTSISLRTYTLTFGGLLLLTALTTVLGFFNLGPMTMVLAVGIAALKAVLIAAFFMHALLEGKMVYVAIASAVVWMMIMLTLTTVDYLTRSWIPVPGK